MKKVVFCARAFNHSQRQTRLDHLLLKRQLNQWGSICRSTTVRQFQCDQIGQYFKVLGNNFSYQKQPKYWVTFSAILKTPFKVKSRSVVYLGNFDKHLGYFLFLHLVTLFSLDLKKLLLHSVSVVQRIIKSGHSGCGSVGKAVAYNARGQRFGSGHR